MTDTQNQVRVISSFRTHFLRDRIHDVDTFKAIKKIRSLYTVIHLIKSYWNNSVQVTYQPLTSLHSKWSGVLLQEHLIFFCFVTAENFGCSNKWATPFTKCCLQQSLHWELFLFLLKSWILTWQTVFQKSYKKALSDSFSVQKAQKYLLSTPNHILVFIYI